MARAVGLSSTQVKFVPTWASSLAAIVDPKVFRAARLVAEYQRQHIPVSRDGSYGRPPGYARDLIGIRVRPGADGLKHYEIGSSATTPSGFPYPVVLDVGSHPHQIDSHGTYPLRNRQTGEVFGRSVNHPGTAPTFWCRGSVGVVAGAVLV